MRIIKKIIYYSIFTIFIIAGTSHLHQEYQIKNSDLKSIKNNHKLKFIIYDFQYNLERFGYKKEILNDIKYYEITSLVDKYQMNGSCSNNVLKINPKVYKMSYNYQKRFLYHELGHCLFNYAHNHVGIMSYNNFNKSMSSWEINSFFSKNNQNYLSLFEETNYVETLFLNTRILHKPLSSPFHYSELYLIHNSTYIYLLINIFTWGYFLFVIVNLLRYLIHSFDDYLGERSEKVGK